jgi:hypothetical protein
MIGVDRLHQREDNREKREKRHKVLDWISSADHRSQHHDIIVKRQSGTGVWLLESDEFQKWVDEPGRT